MTKPPIAGNRTGRKLGQKVKKSKLKASSRRWIERHINDPYVQRARREGLRSRAAFKLKEIDAAHHVLRPGDRVVDLGAAPGGWSQVAAEKVLRAPGGRTEAGCVIGIDVLEMDAVPGVDFIRLDFLDPEAPERLKAMLGGPADAVLSDMAANTVGHQQTDHLRTMALVEAGLEFATEVLRPGGAYVAKVLAGGADNQLVAEMKRHFTTVKHAKPPASRKDSSEWYVIAQGFKGRAGA